MEPEPLSPADVEALLRPDPRTAAADLLVLRDALLRLGDACDRLGHAASVLRRATGEAQRRMAHLDREQPRGTPPRAD